MSIPLCIAAINSRLAIQARPDRPFPHGAGCHVDDLQPAGSGAGYTADPFLAFSRRGRKCLGETSPMQESILTEMAAFCSP